MLFKHAVGDVMTKSSFMQNAVSPLFVDDESKAWSLTKAVLMLGLAALALTIAAIVNQFPLIFYDTSTYLDRANAIAKVVLGDANAAKQIHDALTPGSKVTTGATYNNPFFLRPFTYSAALIPFASSKTLIFVPFAHALLSAYVIRRLLFSLEIRSSMAFGACILALATLSSLPITIAWIMPDIFTGLLVVFSFSIVQGWADRSALGRLFDVGLMTFFVAVHLSHIPITLAIGVLFLLTTWIFRGSFRTSYIIAGVLLPLLIAPMILIASNVVVAKQVAISPSSSLFLLGRFVGDGATQAYLRTACPGKQYVLCSEIDRLDDTDVHGSIMDFFLWGKAGTVSRLADPQLLAEAPELNRKTLRAYPLLIVSSSIKNTARQLLAFQVDDDVNNPPVGFVTTSIHEIDPGLASTYLNSLQSKGEFPIELARFLSNAGLIASLGVLACIAIFHRAQINRSSWFFALFALNGIGANALAIGSLSEVHDRYQNRVMWLVPLVAFVLLCNVITNSRRDQKMTIEGRATAD